MAFHLGKFFIRQFPGLIQQRIRDLNLADIVKRRTAFHFIQVAVGEFAGMMVGLAHLLHDQLCIGGRVADMVAGAFVAAFHQVGQNQNQSVLELGDLLAFLLCVINVGHHIFRHFLNGMIQRLNLVPGSDVQRLKLLKTFFSGLIAFRDKGTGGARNPVNGLYNLIIGRSGAYGQNQNEEAEEQGKNLHQKDASRGFQLTHGEVYSHIALTRTGFVIDGKINRKQAAVCFVGDDRTGKWPAGKQILQIWPKRLVKADHGAGGFPRRVFGVRVKNNMAAIFPDLIDIDEGNIIAAFHDVGQPLSALCIAGGVFSQFQVFFHAFVIKDRGCRVCDPKRHFAFFLNDRLPEEGKTHEGDGDGDQQNRSGDHQQGFAAKRDAPHLPRRCSVRRVRLGRLETRQELGRKQAKNQRRRQNCKKLVQEIDQQICAELRQKQREPSGVIKRPGKRSGDPFSDPAAIQEPGQDTSKPSADQRKNKDGCQKRQNPAKGALPGHPGRADRDQDADGTVIVCRIVRKPVQNIRQKADGDTGHIPSDHGG